MTERALNDLEPQWVTPAQAAFHLACSRATIYTMVKKGTIPHRHFGGRILIHRSVIEEGAPCQSASSGITMPSEPTKTVPFPASPSRP